MPPIEPFKDRVSRLAKERGVSANVLSHETWTPSVKGTSVAMFNSAMQGLRRPGRNLIEAVAEQLEVQPHEFPEYGLAAIRAVPDYRKVGLEMAVDRAREAAAIVLASEAHETGSDAAVRRLRDQVHKGAAQKQDGKPTGKGAGGGSG